MDLEIVTLLRFLADNPVVVLHFLAYASALTLIIAVVTDAFLRQRQAGRGGKILESRPKTRSDLMPRSLPGFEMAKAARRLSPNDRMQPKL